MPKKAPIVVPCSACRKEIPKSTALTPEGADYVRHFCSKDCYQKWFTTQKKA